jgi:hypothetical protein
MADGFLTKLYYINKSSNYLVVFNKLSNHSKASACILRLNSWGAS